MSLKSEIFFFNDRFFFVDKVISEIYTLSLFGQLAFWSFARGSSPHNRKNFFARPGFGRLLSCLVLTLGVIFFCRLGFGRSLGCLVLTIARIFLHDPDLVVC